MKKIQIILLVLFCTLSCKAQNQIIDLAARCNYQLYKNTGNLYLKDVNDIYAPYIGTWKWTDNNREFSITLLKQTKYHYNIGYFNYFKDRIVGYYTYKENNVELINTSNDDLNDDYGVKVDFDIDCYSQVVGNINDVLKNKDYDGWIELLSPTQIKFHFKDDIHMQLQREGYPAVPPKYVGNTFPLDMVLIKQP